MGMELKRHPGGFWIKGHAFHYILFAAIKTHKTHIYMRKSIVHHQYFTLIRFYQRVTLCLFYCGSG